MRTSRAYIAGFGTTTVLVASALLLLAVVSALVAFRGWPGTNLAENIGSLVVDEPERLPVDPPLQVALSASPAAAAVAGAPAPGSAAAGGAGTDDGSDSGGAPGPFLGPQGGANFRAREPTRAPPPPPLQVEDAPRPDLRPAGLLPETPLTPQVVRLTDGLGDTTQGLTDGLGGTVGGLNPQLGQTVIDTGRALSDLLRALGQPRR